MVSVALWTLAVVFVAGQAWKTLKDLKGVSGKVNRVASTNDSRYLALCMVLLQAIPEKDRPAYAAVLYKAMN
jgi:hypothetical protein